MPDEEREEMLRLRGVIIEKLGLLAEQQDREGLLTWMLYMAWHLCVHWPNQVLEIWVQHLDCMLDMQNT